jgi:hypothetical protein
VPSYVPPEKNVAYVFYVSLISQSDTKTAQANPTLAAGDVKVATDDGAPANLATLPAVDADFTKRVKVSLSTGEMNGDNVTVIFSDAAGSEWCDLTINLQTVARQLDDLAWPTTAGRSIDVTAGGNVGIDWNNVETPGATVDLSDTSINLCDTVTTTGTATNLTTNNDKTGYALSAAGVDAIWDEVITGHATADSFGKVFDDQIDGLRAYGDGAWATAVGFSTHSAGDVWAVDATTQQTAGTFGETLGDSAALGTTVHGMVTSILDDTGTSGVQVADKTGYALSAAGVDAIWDEVITGHATADSFGLVFDNQIDGLRAYGDGAWATAVGFSTHAAADVWAVDATTQQTAGTFGETLGDSAALGTTVHAMATSILEDTGTTIPGTITTLQADTDDIQTRIPAALVGGAMDCDVSAMQAGVITAAAIATNAVDADALAADAVTEITAGVWGADATTYQAAGTFGETLGDSAALGTTVHSMATSILEDTGTTLDGRIPAALVGGKMDSDTTAISGDTTAADRLEGLMDGILLVQVNDAAATTTAFAADGFTEATDDHFNGRLITFVTGNLIGQQTDITDYDAAGGAQGNQEFTVTALTEAPGNDDWFVIH